VLRKILLVDYTVSDADMLGLISEGFSKFIEPAGHIIISANAKDPCIALAHKHAPALIVLALGELREDGLKACQQIKSDPRAKNIPLIILAFECADSEVQEVKFLELGVDDYINYLSLTRAESLIARCEAVLRRRYPTPPKESKTLILGGPTSDSTNMKLVIPLKVYNRLTLKEADVLVCLCEHYPAPISRRQLFRAAWPQRRAEIPKKHKASFDHLNRLHMIQAESSLKTVVAYIIKLRAKLGKRIIKNVRGKGYVLNPPAP